MPVNARGRLFFNKYSGLQQQRRNASPLADPAAFQSRLKFSEDQPRHGAGAPFAIST